jgi:hypothetical protein
MRLSWKRRRPLRFDAAILSRMSDNRQIIRDMLAGTDYEITEAEDGEQALAAVAKERRDLILMGIQLPIMDGYEVTRQIKANPAMRSIPDHRRHLPRAGWGRTDSASGRMCWLCAGVLQPTPTTGENSAVHAPISAIDLLHCRMSAYGTKRTCQHAQPMSAFGGKADMAISERDVCF